MSGAGFGCDDRSQSSEHAAAGIDSRNTGTASTTRSHDAASAISYRRIRPVFWAKLYPAGGHSLYCNDQFGSERGRGYNIEHVLPMSWVTRHLNCGSRKQCRQSSALFNRIEADLHNLYPARTAINDARSSYPFAIIAGERRRFGQCDFEVDHQRKVVEPADAVRGEIARAMLYMELTYAIPLFDRQRVLMVQWAQTDPVDPVENRRNRVIREIQGNGNPYIEGRPTGSHSTTEDRVSGFSSESGDAIR